MVFMLKCDLIEMSSIVNYSSNVCHAFVMFGVVQPLCKLVLLMPLPYQFEWHE
jgi:hypothetical protein